MPERIGTVIIGGGQAGLSVSRELGQAGVGHVVLERGRVGQSWRGRWDSFCLVTPNWSVQLPGHSYDGPDPDGFMPRDDLVRYFEHYATAIDAPLREGVEVSSVSPEPGGALLSPPRRETSWPPHRCSAPAPTSGPTGRRQRPRSRPTWSRSTWGITGTRGSYRRARC